MKLVKKRSKKVFIISIILMALWIFGVYMYSKYIHIPINKKSNYEMYYDFYEKISQIPSHRILAINRGEKEEFLKAINSLRK